jgi:putative transcriptional regulator
MAKKAFDKIMAGLAEAEAFLAGEGKGAVVNVIPAVDVRAIRKKIGGSRESFSARFGLDARAVQDWEQRRRTPDRSTRVLMLMIENEPKVVERVVKKATRRTKVSA